MTLATGPSAMSSTMGSSIEQGFTIGELPKDQRYPLACIALGTETELVCHTRLFCRSHEEMSVKVLDNIVEDRGLIDRDLSEDSLKRVKAMILAGGDGEPVLYSSGLNAELHVQARRWYSLELAGALCEGCRLESALQVTGRKSMAWCRC